MPFTKKVLENKKCRSELGQSDPNEKLERLAQDYAEMKETLKKEGFNHAAFDAKIPQAFIIKRKKTEEEQIESLITNKAVFSCSGLFLHTGNMLIIGDAIVKASKKVLQEKKDESLQQIQKATEGVNKTIQEGEEAFQKYSATPPVVTGPVLKSILKFVLLKTKSKDTFSSYTTKQKMKERLSLVEN